MTCVGDYPEGVELKWSKPERLSYPVVVKDDAGNVVDIRLVSFWYSHLLPPDSE